MSGSSVFISFDSRDADILKMWALHEANEALTSIEEMSVSEFEKRVMAAKRILDSINKSSKPAEDLIRKNNLVYLSDCLDYTPRPPSPVAESVAPIGHSTGYDLKAILADKAHFCLDRLKVVSSTREIADEIARIEGLSEVETTKIVRALGATLKQRMDSKIADFNRIEMNDVVYWGKAEWFYMGGMVKEEYKRKPHQVAQVG